MSEKITCLINGNEYPLAMKMLAARTYQQLTGKSLLGSHALNDIFGDEESGYGTNAELYVALIYSLIKNGSYPNELKLTVDDVANSISLSDIDLIQKVTRVWIIATTGKTPEQLEAEKKVVAP
jgi:hypothetical protein